MRLPLSIIVKEIANRNIISLDRDKPVLEAVRLMATNKIGSVVITSEGKPVGIVTERDVLTKVVLEGLDSRTAKAGQVMSTPLVTIEGKASLGEATSLMLDKGIRRLLVVESGKIVGIFTERDLQRKTLDAFMMLRQVA